MFNQNYFNHK